MIDLNRLTDDDIQRIVATLEEAEKDGDIEEVERLSALLYQIKQAKDSALPLQRDSAQ